MAAVGTSLPHSRAISANSRSADSTLPPMSKKFSSIPIDGRCSARCQIGIRASVIAEAVAESVLLLDLDDSNRVMEPRLCACLDDTILGRRTLVWRKLREGCGRTKVPIQWLLGEIIRLANRICFLPGRMARRPGDSAVYDSYPEGRYAIQSRMEADLFHRSGWDRHCKQPGACANQFDSIQRDRSTDL